MQHTHNTHIQHTQHTHAHGTHIQHAYGTHIQHAYGTYTRVNLRTPVFGISYLKEHQRQHKHRQLWCMRRSICSVDYLIVFLGILGMFNALFPKLLCLHLDKRCAVVDTRGRCHTCAPHLVNTLTLASVCLWEQVVMVYELTLLWLQYYIILREGGVSNSDNTRRKWELFIIPDWLVSPEWVYFRTRMVCSVSP